MESRIEEGSEALTTPSQFPSRISAEQLERLKVGIADQMDFPVTGNDYSFNRTSEEWIGMEEILSKCYIAVFNRYHDESDDKDKVVIFILAPSIPTQYQVWISEKGDCSDLTTIDQALEMRNE